MRKAVSTECDNNKEPPYLNNNDIIKMFSNSEVVCFLNLHALYIFSYQKYFILMKSVYLDFTDGNKSEREFADGTLANL